MLHSRYAVQSFGSGGTYVQHSRKMRIKFLPKTFAPYVRKLPQGLWNVLVTRDAVPRGEVLPPELLKGEFVLREGERPCLNDIYPWTFEGDPHVMSTIQSQVAMADPSCLKDLVKWRTFGLITPHNNHTISGLHTVGNVFFEKRGLVPYPCFRTAVHNKPFSTDLAWNLERVGLIIPQWQRERGGVRRRVYISQAVRHNLSLKPQII
jgi:hypothetical protein